MIDDFKNKDVTEMQFIQQSVERIEKISTRMRVHDFDNSASRRLSYMLDGTISINNKINILSKNIIKKK